MPWKPFFIKTIFHPCLSTGSMEIFIKKSKKKKKKICLLKLKGFRGQSIEDISPEKSIFFYWRPPNI